MQEHALNGVVRGSAGFSDRVLEGDLPALVGEDIVQT